MNKEEVVTKSRSKSVTARRSKSPAEASKSGSGRSRSGPPLSRKLKKRRHSSSESGSSSSSGSSVERKKRRKEKKLKKIAKKEKKRVRKAAKLAAAAAKAVVAKIPVKAEVSVKEGPDRLLADRARAMAPMTKEEWDKRQKVIRKVLDPTTGRHRLVKGDGEVIEECVSRERHKEINRKATRGDGDYFQSFVTDRHSKRH